MVTGYEYDSRGNTTTRGDQALGWDVNNKLATVSVGGSLRQKAVAGSDGNRLVRVVSSPAGDRSTVYHPDGTEAMAATDGTGTADAERYYSLGGRTVALRQSNLYSSVISWVEDPQGSITHSYVSATGVLTPRRQTPFGGSRGADTSPGQRRFVGATQDAAVDLLQVGIRPYDAAQGRFLSVDPVVNFTDPVQTAAAYAYGKNDPVANADPTGAYPSGGRSLMGFIQLLFALLRLMFYSNPTPAAPIQQTPTSALSSGGVCSPPPPPPPPVVNSNSDDGGGLFKSLGDGLKSAAGAVGDAAGAIGSGAKSAGEFLWENKTQITVGVVTYAAAGTCAASLVCGAGVLALGGAGMVLARGLDTGEQVSGTEVAAGAGLSVVGGGVLSKLPGVGNYVAKLLKGRSGAAANAGRDSVVIGRGMTRVREAAGVLDAGTYEASGLTKALAARGFVKPMLLENRLWLRGQMLRGRTIYDIGHGGIEMPSIFYGMERATVHGYRGYAPVPWVG